MKKILNCRRSSLSLIGIIVLGIGLFNGVDTSGAIAMICIGLAGSNSFEKATIGKAEFQFKKKE